ncbi:MAG: hypothetical protein C0504_13495 [Candidatus Solibacter sp.]|nr:hypothetical protein [Candidatus Solibacter sp.]
MPVNATRFVRKMRGGAQAHLLATDDLPKPPFFVTKFVGNPQHNRILVNEWIAGRLLAHLQIAAPDLEIVNVPGSFLRDCGEVHFQFGCGRKPVEPGWHLGSRFPGNPDTDAVYDFLPDSLLPQVHNVADFRGALVFDKWVSNSDARQAIFFRRRIRDWIDSSDAGPQQKGFIAQMIDNGYAFDGPHWEFADSPLQGVYMRPGVYAGVRTLDDFQPWLDWVRHFPQSVVDAAYRDLPRRWLDGNEAGLEQLLDRLIARRVRVADLILATVRNRARSFPDWLG